MVNLNFCDTNLSFVNICKQDLPQVLEWYNNVDEFKYGTGVDKPLSLKELGQRYLQTSVSRFEFFAWILAEGQRVGIIKGSVKYLDKSSIWINSLVIDTRFRRKGYGRRAVDALQKLVSNHIRLTKIYVSVVKDNTEGINFWSRIGFVEVKKIEKMILLDGIQRDVIIMCKAIN